jgi:hypothetical protein
MTFPREDARVTVCDPLVARPVVASRNVVPKDRGNVVQA